MVLICRWQASSQQSFGQQKSSPKIWVKTKWLKIPPGNDRDDFFSYLFLLATQGKRPFWLASQFVPRNRCDLFDVLASAGQRPKQGLSFCMPWPTFARFNLMPFKSLQLSNDLSGNWFEKSTNWISTWLTRLSLAPRTSSSLLWLAWLLWKRATRHERSVALPTASDERKAPLKTIVLSQILERRSKRDCSRANKTWTPLNVEPEFKISPWHLWPLRP